MCAKRRTNPPMFLRSIYLCLGALTLALVSALAQQVNNFTAATGDITVAASASTLVTIQQRASSSGFGTKTVTLTNAVAQCANTTPGGTGISFDVNQYQGATTAATATAETVIALPPNVVAVPVASVYSSSNVVVSQSISDTLSYPAGSIAALSFPAYVMGSSGNKTSYSLKVTNTGASSCLVRVTLFWSEQ